MKHAFGSTRRVVCSTVPRGDSRPPGRRCRANPLELRLGHRLELSMTVVITGCRIRRSSTKCLPVRARTGSVHSGGNFQIWSSRSTHPSPTTFRAGMSSASAMAVASMTIVSDFPLPWVCQTTPPVGVPRHRSAARATSSRTVKTLERAIFFSPSSKRVKRRASSNSLSARHSANSARSCLLRPCSANREGPALWKRLANTIGTSRRNGRSRVLAPLVQPPPPAQTSALPRTYRASLGIASSNARPEELGMTLPSDCGSREIASLPNRRSARLHSIRRSGCH